MDKLHNANELAAKFLRFLGKKKPTQEQLRLTEKLLMTAVVQEHLHFNCFLM